MSDSKPPVIIKLHPDLNDYRDAETKFFYTLGICINRWAFADRQLFRLCRFGLNLDSRQTALQYYRDQAFNRTLKFVDSCLRSVMTKEQAARDWEPVHDRAHDLSQTRNVIAHHPAKRLGASDGTKAVYVYSIHIEPYFLALNKKIPGLRGKTELSVEDLEQHAIEVDALEADLKSLHRKLVASR